MAWFVSALDSDERHQRSWTSNSVLSTTGDRFRTTRALMKLGV